MLCSRQRHYLPFEDISCPGATTKWTLRLLLRESRREVSILVGPFRLQLPPGPSRNLAYDLNVGKQHLNLICLYATES
jgi:hypothetical protein